MKEITKIKRQQFGRFSLYCGLLSDQLCVLISVV